MANCNSQFGIFNQAIRITEERRYALMTARDDLLQRIINSFNDIKVWKKYNHEGFSRL